MKAFFTEEFIEEVRMNNDIVEVVSEYVHLKRKGRYFFGLCPFHNERTPSFTVTPDLQIFNCFGCNKGGNVIHFIMSIENLDFVEAIKFLAERAGMELPGNDNSESAKEYKLKTEILNINKFVAQSYYNNLMSEKGSGAREYLSRRKINHAVVKKFGLGYSFPGNTLYELLQEKGFSKEAIIKSGLVIEGKRGKYFDRFRNRLMFPIFDVRGNVIGFGGRALDDTLPKYMNSPETLVYNKGRNLYALNFAKNFKDKKLIIVEGYMDVITLHQNGIINSVASLGTALTENQGRLLKKYAEEVIISFDADAAGQKAAMRSLDMLTNIGCKVKVLTIPNGKDPDEYVRENGPEAFKELIDNSMNLVEYKIGAVKKNIDTNTTEGKIEFVKKAAEILSLIESPAELEIYIRKISEQYEISMGSLYAEVQNRKSPKKVNKELRSFSKRQNVPDGKKEFLNKIEISKTFNNDKKIIYSELILIAILCMDNSVFKLVKDKYDLNSFSEENKHIASYVYEKLEAKARIVPVELLNSMDADKAGEFARILEQECNFDDSEKAVVDIINRLFTLKLENRKQEILEKIRNKDKLNLNSLQINELLKELNDLVFEIKKYSEP
ncbi:MAG TPA: DNA primase [Clostridiaceae bacterium]|nr:DNA primase [Clostridiaceae bacterium]